MSTVEMEVFSNTQLVILIILMVLGGEVFTSMIGLQFASYKKFTKLVLHHQHNYNNNNSSNSMNVHNHMELNSITTTTLPQENEKIDLDVENGNNIFLGGEYLKRKAIKCLGFVVLGYYLVVHICGYCFVNVYLRIIPSAGDVIIKKKGLQLQTFVVFTIVSTFTNCGFIPTNENMIVFKKNSGLLLLLIPQVLLGNTLFPPCLRFVIWVLARIFSKRVEFRYMLKNCREMGYSHLLSSRHSSSLALTVFGFILVQFVLFCSMAWNSEVMSDLNPYQKVVASLFEVVNSRHAGESVFDLSIIPPAILVLFVVMMYFPSYTSFLPIDDHETVPKKGRKLVDNQIFSQLSYLVIFIILICVTERRNMKEDPLNFNVLNILIEVISAYGNVGFSTGYSCKRRLKPDSYCQDAWYGFAGRWSNEGKLILILVMFFGRLKKFSMEGGQAWKLS